MFIKKLLIAATIAILCVANANAGVEDWDGLFNIKTTDGKQNTVMHTPKYVKYLFFSAGNCLSFRKGSKINGVEILEDVNLCTSSSPETFTKEVAKLGVIVDKNVTIGPSYNQ